MAKIRAVVDAGPVIHLEEVGYLHLLAIFDCITAEEISKEVKLPKFVKVTNLSGNYKDFSKSLTEKFQLQLGDVQCIALAMQEKIKIFLTDDLEARIMSKQLSLEPHGTIGIILRAFRNKTISKEKAFLLLDSMKTKSSLFVTSDIINYAKHEIEKFRK